MAAILRYAKRPEFDEFRIQALEEFEEDHLDHLSEADRRRSHDLDWGVKFSFWWLFDMPYEDDGSSLGRRFLAEEGHKLQRAERELLERYRTSSLRLYEVQEIQLDSGVRLIDLWLQDEVLVSERMLTHQLQQWDLLAARVVEERERRAFEGGAYLYRADHKGHLMESLKKERARLRKVAPEMDDGLFFKLSAPFFHQFWLHNVVYRPLPKMVTAEGDPMIFGKAVFDVLDTEKLVSALNRHPELQAEEQDQWSWGEEAQEFRRGLGDLTLEGNRLTLETTSRQRAERGRRLLEEAAGPFLRHRASSFESVEQLMKKPRPPRDPSDEIPPQVAAQAVREYKDKHYKTWPDVPLPALDGRTPRHAAELKTLRPKLIDLLKSMENSEARTAAPDEPAYDFGWIWTELGLERP